MGRLPAPHLCRCDGGLAESLPALHGVGGCARTGADPPGKWVRSQLRRPPDGTRTGSIDQSLSLLDSRLRLTQGFGGLSSRWYVPGFGGPPKDIQANRSIESVGVRRAHGYHRSVLPHSSAPALTAYELP